MVDLAVQANRPSLGYGKGSNQHSPARKQVMLTMHCPCASPPEKHPAKQSCTCSPSQPPSAHEKEEKSGTPTHHPHPPTPTHASFILNIISSLIFRNLKNRVDAKLSQHNNLFSRARSRFESIRRRSICRRRVRRRPVARRRFPQPPPPSRTPAVGRRRPGA